MFFESGTFNAVLTVCPPSPNVDRRGSEWHLFLQRPDHRLHFTNHVCCQAIGLRITSRPLICRNIDVMRLLSRKLGFPRSRPISSPTAGFLPNFSARECFYGPRVCHAFSRNTSGLDPFVCCPTWTLWKPTHANVSRSWSLSWRRTSKPPPATHARPQARNGSLGIV